MTILPAGVPIWGRAASMETYGGHLQKRDYGEIGAVNALTDVTAAQYCRLTSDAASASRCIALCTMSLTRSGTTITVNMCVPLWAVPVLTAYDGSAAPTLYPSAALTGTNEVTVTLPTSATDEFSVSQAITPLLALPCAAGVSWDGAIVANAIVLSGFTTGLTVPLMVW